ncbi:MAG: hypothetical protein R8G66_00385 [Cytophagales bacterium]|nr:hypothetical protein [Cytophagales bacterium]
MSMLLGQLSSAQLLRSEHEYLWQGRGELKTIHWLEAFDVIRNEIPPRDTAYFQCLIHLNNGNQIPARKAIKHHAQVPNHRYPYETKILLGLANSSVYYTAYGHFVDAIKMNPKRVDGYLEKVKVFSDQKDYLSGIDHANEAIRLFPEFNELYVYRGNLYINEGLRKRAFKDFKHVIDSEKPLSDFYMAQAHRGLAWSYLGRNDVVQAEIHLMESKIMEAYHPLSQGILVEINYLKGDATGAIEAYESIIGTEDRENYYLMMGLAHEELNQNEEACGFYKACCRREIALACVRS